MDLLLSKQKQRIYIYTVILILLLGIAFRLYGIGLRIVFLDEGVHYSFIHSLWTSKPYNYKEVVNLSKVSTVNDGLNLYYSFQDKSEKNKNLWNVSDYKYKDYIKYPAFFNIVNDLVQPYYYLKHLINNPGYKYDPVYHGPFLYYVGDLVFTLAGDHSLYLVRLPIVLASILGLFFILLYREYLGKYGLIISLVLASLSPGLIYFSNLGNYENYMAVFSLLGVGLLLLGIKKRSPAILFVSGFVLLSLMTVKETALVTWFCVVVATILTYIVVYIKERPSKLLKNIEDYIIDIFDGVYTGSILRYFIPAMFCFLCAGVFFALLYSSFGGHLQGVYDGLTSWMYWKNTGAQSGHDKAFGYYTDVILQYDFMLTFMFFIGTLVTIFSSRDKYKLFISFWAIVVWFVYSFIPYKTPWLIINFLFPFAVSAGIGWNIIFSHFNKKTYKYIATFIILVFSVGAIFTAIHVKFIDYDSEANKLTYVHTVREFEEEVKALYSLILASPEGANTDITVAAPEYWPIPAFVIGYNNIGYFGGVRGRNLNLNAPIVINDTRDNPELRELMLESDINDYVKLKDFYVRPGVSHTIFVKDDLLKRYLAFKYYTFLTKPGKSALLEKPPWD